MRNFTTKHCFVFLSHIKYPQQVLHLSFGIFILALHMALGTCFVLEVKALYHNTPSYLFALFVHNECT